MWQISAASLLEALRPAGFVLAALLSAWALAVARRRSFSLFSTAPWTLGVLFLPQVVLPLYLAALLLFPGPRQKADATPDAPAGRARSLVLRLGTPALYLLAVLALGALHFYRDAQSVDGLLARAGAARLAGRRDETIRALQAALAAEDDPHARKLLGVELAAAGRFDDALRELRAAERGGDPDDVISYHVAASLDALGRQAEAAAAYRIFLQTDTCARKLPAAQCLTAGARLRAARSQPAGEVEKY